MLSIKKRFLSVIVWILFGLIGTLALEANVENNLEAILSSWELENGKKRVESTDSKTLFSLYDSIGKIDDLEKREKFYDRFANIVLTMINNSVQYKEKQTIKYFTGYCPSSEYMDAIDSSEIIFKYLNIINDIPNLAEEYQIVSDSSKIRIDILLREHLKKAFQVWSAFTPSCDTLKAYTQCSDKYREFLAKSTKKKVFSHIDFAVEMLMVSEEEHHKIISAAKSLLEQKSPDCRCLAAYRDVLENNYAEYESVFIQKIEKKLEDSCIFGCAWDITFRQVGVVEQNKCYGSGTEIPDNINMKVIVHFNNIFMLPSPDRSNWHENLPDFVKNADQYKICNDLYYHEQENSTHSVYSLVSRSGRVYANDKINSFTSWFSSEKVSFGVEGVNAWFSVKHDSKDFFEKMKKNRKFTITDDECKTSVEFTPVYR